MSESAAKEQETVANVEKIESSETSIAGKHLVSLHIDDADNSKSSFNVDATSSQDEWKGARPKIRQSDLPLPQNDSTDDSDEQNSEKQSKKRSLSNESSETSSSTDEKELSYNLLTSTISDDDLSSKSSDSSFLRHYGISKTEKGDVVDYPLSDDEGVGKESKSDTERDCKGEQINPSTSGNNDDQLGAVGGISEALKSDDECGDRDLTAEELRMKRRESRGAPPRDYRTVNQATSLAIVKLFLQRKKSLEEILSHAIKIISIMDKGNIERHNSDTCGHESNICRKPPHKWRGIIFAWDSTYLNITNLIKHTRYVLYGFGSEDITPREVFDEYIDTLIAVYEDTLELSYMSYKCSRSYGNVCMTYEDWCFTYHVNPIGDLLKPLIRLVSEETDTFIAFEADFVEKEKKENSAKKS